MEANQRLIYATMAFTREDKKHSWFYFLSTLALAIAAITGTVIFHGLPRIVCSLLMSLFMVRMFVIYHDFRHNAILHDSMVAQVFMTFFGVLSLAPASIWNETHEHHHHNNSKLSTFVVGSFPIMSTSLHPAEIVRCLRLKLWDVDRKRLVTMQEFREMIRIT